MVYNYDCKKKQKIDKIKSECKNLNIDQLEKILEEINKQKPKTLDEYVRDIARENIISPTETEIESVGRALGTEVRSLCIDLGCKLHKLRVENGEYAEHWVDLYVQESGKYNYTLELDTWILEKGTLFNPSMLANIIFKLYCKEIVFR